MTYESLPLEEKRRRVILCLARFMQPGIPRTATEILALHPGHDLPYDLIGMFHMDTGAKPNDAHAFRAWLTELCGEAAGFTLTREGATFKIGGNL